MHRPTLSTGLRRIALACAVLVTIAPEIAAQDPPRPGAARGGAPGQQGRGRGRGRGGIQQMTLTPIGWRSGGEIPVKHSQAGSELSPGLSWSGAPEGTQSFVLVVHDVNAATQNQRGLDDVLHWLVWNIPGTATSLPEGLPAQAELGDGTRQISATGPYYRGPAAAASGPVHHYLFELYALDTLVNVPAVGASPAATRAAVMEAMTGRVRGKAVVVGLYRRPPP
jgi:Raf kinase inhibitor-like YbhB/YbcL family protein